MDYVNVNIEIIFNKGCLWVALLNFSLDVLFCYRRLFFCKMHATYVFTIHTYFKIYLYACMHAYIHMYVCIYMYYIHIYIHTYIQIYKFKYNILMINTIKFFECISVHTKKIFPFFPFFFKLRPKEIGIGTFE